MSTEQLGLHSRRNLKSSGRTRNKIQMLHRSASPMPERQIDDNQLTANRAVYVLQSQPNISNRLTQQMPNKNYFQRSLSSVKKRHQNIHKLRLINQKLGNAAQESQDQKSKPIHSSLRLQSGQKQTQLFNSASSTKQLTKQQQMHFKQQARKVNIKQQQGTTSTSQISVAHMIDVVETRQRNAAMLRSSESQAIIIKNDNDLRDNQPLDDAPVTSRNETPMIVAKLLKQQQKVSSQQQNQQQKLLKLQNNHNNTANTPNAETINYPTQRLSNYTKNSSISASKLQKKIAIQKAAVIIGSQQILHHNQRQQPQIINSSDGISKKNNYLSSIVKKSMAKKAGEIQEKRSSSNNSKQMRSSIAAQNKFRQNKMHSRLLLQQSNENSIKTVVSDENKYFNKIASQSKRVTNQRHPSPLTPQQWQQQQREASSRKSNTNFVTNASSIVNEEEKDASPFAQKVVELISRKPDPQAIIVDEDIYGQKERIGSAVEAALDVAAANGQQKQPVVDADAEVLQSSKAARQQIHLNQYYQQKIKEYENINIEVIDKSDKQLYFNSHRQQKQDSSSNQYYLQVSHNNNSNERTNFSSVNDHILSPIPQLEMSSIASIAEHEQSIVVQSKNGRKNKRGSDAAAAEVNRVFEDTMCSELALLIEQISSKK